VIKSKPTTKEYRNNFDRTFRSRDLPRKISVADPDPIKLNEDVVVVIKTLDGDIEI
jgi:hypothetical protein